MDSFATSTSSQESVIVVELSSSRFSVRYPRVTDVVRAMAGLAHERSIALGSQRWGTKHSPPAKADPSGNAGE